MGTSTMKKYALIIFALLAFIPSFSQQEKDLPAAPNPPRLVNDLTGTTITKEQADALEQKLKRYDDTTSNQIAIIITNDLKGFTAEDYAIKVGRKWGVGNKTFDNGVVVLVYTGGPAGDRDLIIQVGYGLEDKIADITAKAIIDREMIPAFKEGNIYRGLDDGTNALIKAAEGKYKAPEGWGNRGRNKGIHPIIIVLIVIGLLMLFGGIGGAGGGYVSRRGYTDWTGGGWSSRGGGGGWSGGGGGGFGGFGGGSFGGGGASGKW